MEKIYFSLESDKKFKTYQQAYKSNENFSEGFFCKKCKCITMTICNCKKED